MLRLYINLVIALVAVSADAAGWHRAFGPAVFYDGYEGAVVDSLAKDGVLRHSNSLYSQRIDPALFGSDSLKIRVTVNALCDNYDRLGNVSLAFVPKGREGYDPDSVTRFELCRFVTPFMNKNVEPSEVVYRYDYVQLGRLFRSGALIDSCDVYCELEIFGVPYAAQKQVEGCASRKDTFIGAVDFMAGSDKEKEAVAVPIAMKRSFAHGNNLNNYKNEATDTLGVTTKTYRVSLSDPIDNALLYVIVSNHGANMDGEEYNRRKHYVYVDGQLMLAFLPGIGSCEPYRVRNTQPNGIYGREVKSDEWWEEWNNWCPGAEIPTRAICLGALSAGEHEVMIRVPDAVFPQGEGDFPLSMYIIGEPARSR